MPRETAAQKKARLAAEQAAKAAGKGGDAAATHTTIIIETDANKPDNKPADKPKTAQEMIKEMQEQLAKLQNDLDISQADEKGREKALNLFGKNTAALSELPLLKCEYIMRVEETTRRKNPDSGKWESRTAHNDYLTAGVLEFPNGEKIVLNILVNKDWEPTEFGFEYLTNFSGNYIHTPTGRSMYVLKKYTPPKQEEEKAPEETK